MGTRDSIFFETLWPREIPAMQRELAAEFVGTFSLVTAVCGAALFSAPQAGLVAIALAVGLSVLAMAFAVGHISGAHFNPAVTCGLVAAGRFPVERAPVYIVAQVLGGAPPAKWNTFTTISNLYGSGGFSMGVVFLTETVITALFLVVIVGATSRGAPAGFAPIAIGLALTMFHLVAIPISNASLNPARSTATAIFGGARALDALWLFWVAPILGGVIGGVICRWLQDETPNS
jgi:aquaporin Z